MEKMEKAIINFEDFSRLDLRTGKIITVEEVPGLDKLWKLKVSLGEKEMTILAGVCNYSREELLGKTVVAVVNLEPKAIRGIVSEGMLLAADVSEGAVLITPEKEVREGSVVR